MFVDKIQIKIAAGSGGKGIVSFRKEKYVERGGPDGGDGGKGGDIIAIASNNQNTLASFRYKKQITAEPGHSGDKRKKHGKNGNDLSIKLPVGTVIYDQAKNVLADLTSDGQKAVIAKGGAGGFGNAHFISSTRQAPRIAEKGEPGESLEVVFELKMIADVGLVGLPNAGKSTLLSRVSNAHPQIANYPFTTLRPNLGVVDIDKDSTMLFADIPGLIKGASKGKGLGDEFLRHVERTKLLVHLIDCYQEDVGLAYKTIQKELADYAVDLSKRPQIIALNKIDGLDQEIIDSQIARLAKVAGKTKVLPISAQSGRGLNEMLYAVKKLGQKRPTKRVAKEKQDTIPVISLKPRGDKWEVKKSRGKYIVTGEKIEKFAHRTDFNNYAAIERIRDIMRKMGIMHELERKGAEPDSIVQLGKDEIGTIKY